MTEQDREALKRIHSDGEQCVKSNDPKGYTVANRQFHDAIHEGCRNQYLVEQIWDLRLRIRSYGQRPYQRAGGIQRSFDGHAEIIKAVLAGDPHKAGAAMSEHVSGGLSLIDFLVEASADWTGEKEPHIPTAQRKVLAADHSM